MKEKIKKGKIPFMHIILVMVVLAGWFYWFQYRPLKIRSYCNRQAVEKATLKKENQKSTLLDSIYDRIGTRDKDIFNSEDYKVHYNICLNEKGLK